VGGRLLGVVSSVCLFSFFFLRSFYILGVSDVWYAGADYYRDIAAGAAILLEAGGLMTTANPPEDVETAPIEDVRLGSRLYLAIR
jgi:myo-inositol-1(or 4)-monophosphatase